MLKNAGFFLCFSEIVKINTREKFWNLKIAILNACEKFQNHLAKCIFLSIAKLRIRKIQYLMQRLMLTEKLFHLFFFSVFLWFCCYYHVLNVSCHNWLSFLLPDFAGFLKEVIHKSFDDFVDIGTTHYFNTILSQVFLLLNGFFSSANLKRLTISS